MPLNAEQFLGYLPQLLRQQSTLLEIPQECRNDHPGMHVG